MTTDHASLLERHKARVAALASSDSRYVVNKDWDPFIGGARPKIIAIADNPGREERATGVYLCVDGRAGSIARDFFDGVFGSGSFSRDVLTLNKSSFHTGVTSGLTKMLRKGGCTREEAEAIRADMRANGKLVVQLSAALASPVIFIGSESDNTFEAFRGGVDCELEKAGYISAMLEGVCLNQAFYIIPHFSRCAAFCKHSDEAWNQRVDAFATRWPQVHGLKTKSDNLSWVAMRDRGGRDLLVDYLMSVMLASSSAAQA